MPFNPSRTLGVACLLAGIPCSSVFAREEDPLRFKDHRGIVTFSLENDVFSGEDNNYTNGFRLAFLSPESNVPEWLEHTADLFPLFEKRGYKRWGVVIGQSMFTPDNLALRPPSPDDQPYAGWLYLGTSLIRDTGHTLDSFQIELGVVGPYSHAAEIQDLVHDLLHSPDPQGWDSQLHNEPGLVLTYERKWRRLYEFSPFGLGVDITPSMGGSLGNVFTHLNIGAVARLGYDLPTDYGPPLIRPSLSGSDFFVPNRNVGWYLFTGLEGRAVARNIFLDGNTFRDSPSVDKRHFVGGVQAGAALTIGDLRIAYTHVLRSDQFKGQRKPETFGAITASYRF